MQIDQLHKAFDELQIKHGEPSLCAIYGAGCIERPRCCFVFMNSTGRNIAANPNWSGLRAPWLGTKNIWKLFSKVGVIESRLNDSIQKMRPEEWSPDFAERVYRQIAERGFYVTNLSKSTQSDARALPDSVFREYLPWLKQEINIIKPRVIVTLGNQVSSIVLAQTVNVSRQRRAPMTLSLADDSYKVYPVYYPVGQGMRNLPKAARDIKWILKLD